MRRSALTALLVAVLALGACGGDDGGDDGGATAPVTTAPATTATQPPSTSTIPPAEHDVALWFLDDKQLTRLTVRAPQTEGVARQALELLLAGPPGGYQTALTPAPALADIAIADMIATVQLDGPRPEGLAEAQIVSTLTEFATVRWVRFGDEPGLVSRQSANGGEDAAPPVELVRAEPTGTEVRYAGTANVFEANVQVRLVQDGETIADGFTTATCGTGCRGSFAGALPIPDDAVGPARLEAFTTSAEDGSERDVVGIDVDLG